MRFDDDYSSNNEVATVNGDLNRNDLARINVSRSRDAKLKVQGDTVKLENASSKENEDVHSNQTSVIVVDKGMTNLLDKTQNDEGQR